MKVLLAMGVQVDVLNVLGAGDAFISGFLRGWLKDESYEKCCAYANACGALVVSRHGCAPAIPLLRRNLIIILLVNMTLHDQIKIKH